MSTRRVLHHGPTPQGTPVQLSDRAINGCWFELHRQGGCGAGELILQREFGERRAIEIGDWISCEGAVGHRWYLGRVEECRYQYPGLVRLRLAGMSIELNEVFPGGFGTSPVDQQPQRYGATDLFSNDPDRNWEAAHPVSTIDGFVRLLMQHHVVNKTHISYVPSLIETTRSPVQALTAKFRGEESLRSVLKDLALRAQASWGVDAFGRFFFLRRRISVQTTFRLGRDLVSLEESRDRELLFNRLLLTGDYIYDQRENSGQIARRVFRWRANYYEPGSCQTFGNRRLRLWVPWIRTQSDSISFARELFRIYSQPTPRYSIESVPSENLIVPWEGTVSIEDASGALLVTGVVEKVRVLFDHAPRFRLEVGHEDPREQWPEPPQDERWELPDHVPSNRADVSLTDLVLSSDGGGGGGNSSQGHQTSSIDDSDDSIDLSSDHSSFGSSFQGSQGSSDSVSRNSSSRNTGNGSDFLSDLNSEDGMSTSQRSTELSNTETSSWTILLTDSDNLSTTSNAGASSSDDQTTMSHFGSQMATSDQTLTSGGQVSSTSGLLVNSSSGGFPGTSQNVLNSTAGNATSNISGGQQTSDDTSLSTTLNTDSIDWTDTSLSWSTSTGNSSFWTSLDAGLSSLDTQHSTHVNHSGNSAPH